MNIIKKWTESSLILKIVIGLIIGAILGILVPSWKFIGFPGELFVSALKAIAPLLVFVLVASAISKAKRGIGDRFKTVIILYIFTTFLSAMVAVAGSYLFPVTIHLSAASTQTAPGGLGEIIYTLILGIFSNPIHLLSEGQYLGILFWSIVFGIALKAVASDNTKNVLTDCADEVTMIVRGIIQCAPFGIMGLVFTSVSESGINDPCCLPYHWNICVSTGYHCIMYYFYIGCLWGFRCCRRITSFNPNGMFSFRYKC